MREINAMGVSAGMGTGAAFILEKKRFVISHEPSADPVLELERFEKALEKVTYDTRKLLDTARAEEADILDAYLMLLADPATTDDVRALIARSYNATLAVKEAIGSIVGMFEALDDAYMRERAFDIQDIMNILLRELLGIKPQDISAIPPGSVIIADDLATSDTAKMNMDHIAGIITAAGGQNSHTSIVARSFEIPAIVGAGQAIEAIDAGDEILIDGAEGRAVVRPTEEARARFMRRNDAYAKEKELYKRFIGHPSITKDGRKIEILANIGTPGELQRVLGGTAEGIGLFRSEFLFMDKKDSPDEQTQFAAYREVAAAMKGKTVTIRTMDIGGDKHLDYLNFEKEDNPFLGYRAIRISLDRDDLFRTQLRAILRASDFGPVRILFPFISSLEELLSAKTALEAAKDALRREGVR
ncbi:MAG: phosphoenolpyruvate--protein phosphotransferase, partial [Oscillospiraceae bacterium]|nr:phosphoenolpyruvate--protein phosphotransferase [Oscillospiraceae bacterium]